MTFPALLLLLAATASLVPTSCASNLLRKLSVNDGDVIAPNQPSLGDSPVIGEIEAISQDSALSMRLDTSIGSFQQPYPQESLLVSTTSLTGYLMIAIFTDTTCTKIQSALAQLLDACIEVSSGYQKLTTTATDYITTYYSDKECTMVTSTDAPAPFTSGCNGYMIYVSANGVLSLPSAIVGISRYVVVSITFSCHSRRSSSCCFLRLPMKLRFKSYKSTYDLTNVKQLKDSPT